MQRPILKFNPQGIQPIINSPSGFEGQAKFLNEVAKITAAYAEQNRTIWLKAQRASAEKAGAEAGAGKAPPTLMEENIAGMAYNKAAIDSYASKMSSKGKFRLNEIHESNKTNPDEYLAASQKYIDSVISTMNDEGVVGEDILEYVASGLKFKQQSDLTTVSDKYRALQKDKFQAETETFIESIEIESYEVASDLFGESNSHKLMAMETYTLNYGALTGKLYSLNSDGTPMYTKVEAQKRLKDYEKNFFISSYQEYIRDHEITPEMISDVQSGELSIKMFDETGKEKEIRILDRVGVEGYKNDIMDYTISEIDRHEKRRKKIELEEEKELNEKQALNFFDTTLSIMERDLDVTYDSIEKDVAIGKLSPEDGRAALKLLNTDPASTEDLQILSELIVNQARQIDITNQLKRSVGKISKESYIDLVEKNAKTLQSKADQVDDENEAYLEREIVKTGPFGYTEPSTVRDAAEVIQYYRQLRNNNVSPELAYEKSTQIIDYVKQDDIKIFDRKPIVLYMSMDESGKNINFEKTAKNLTDAYRKNEISSDVYQVEMDKLEEAQIKQGVPVNNASLNQGETDEE